MPEKDDVRQSNQDDFFNERGFQCIHRMPDERTAIVERHDADAFGQAGLHRLDLCLNGVDDVERIRAVADDDHAADGIFTAAIENAAPEFRTHLHRRYVS